MEKIKRILILFIIITAVIFLADLIRNAVHAVDENGNVVVVLDPGHGGNEPGCLNPEKGLVERDVNLKIALYAKAELEKYPEVKVYLTHNGLTPDTGMSLYDRAQVAKNVNADILISLHINDVALNWTIMTGAEVYVTRDTSQARYNYASTILGNAVLNRLGSIGIGNRGVKIKDSEVNYYADGALADWYGIIRESMNNGIPGIIIEHCFMRSSDSQFIDTDAKLQLLGTKDAEAIAGTYGLDKGNINSELKTITLSKDAYGRSYISGQMIVVEWVNRKINCADI
ncbi:MAG: N-acetylmuramoyl-L-alanine amidase [Firmicutes bacterium]|nr:N-acetylmuramoyl-L-alanine amidase [Bacillota bacterium]